MKTPKKPKISVFMDHPLCSAHCLVSMNEALYEKYDVYSFTIDQLKKSKTLKNTKVIAFPGGIGDSEKFHTRVRPHMEPILEFMNNGGKYLGICMGAYWAGPRYFDLLKGVDAVQYITRPDADIRRPYGTTAEVVWEGSKQHMYFYDGCALVGEGEFDTVATYKNGDAMAIIQGNTGVIGCHPESMRSWYEKPYMKSRWHEYHHHKLLSDFVDKLLLT